MTKTRCDFCKKMKDETRLVYPTGDEIDEPQAICKDCFDVETPYLEWEKLEIHKE